MNDQNKEKAPKAYPTRKTLGASAFEPYRVLGIAIRRDAIKARLDIFDLAERSGWDWQTVRRIMVGTRRTDFVELLIIASILSANQEEVEKLVANWAREVFGFIRQDIHSK